MQTSVPLQANVNINKGNIPSIIGIKCLNIYSLLLESGDQRANQLTVIICSKASGFLEYPADPPSCSIVCRISSLLHTNINDKRR